MYSSTNSNSDSDSRLQFEFEQFESQYNKLSASKTQREGLLNSNELVRITEGSERLSCIIRKFDSKQRGQFNRHEVAFIRVMAKNHLKIELFAALGESLKCQAIDTIYNDCLCLKKHVHMKYWILYKACILLEINSTPQNRIFLKQFERIENGKAKSYVITPLFYRLVSKLIENEQNGITCKTEEIIKLEKNLLNVMQIVYDKFQNHLEVENPANDVIYTTLQYFQFTEQDCMKPRFGIAERLYRGICSVLRSIANNRTQDSLDFVSKFAIMTKDGQIDRFTFSPSYDEFEKEGLRLEYMNEPDIQTSLDYVVSVHEILKDFARFIKNVPDGGDDLSLLCYTSLYNELIDLINSKKDSMDYSRYPDLIEIKIHWARVMVKIKKEIEAQTQQELETEKFLDSGFNHNTSVLRVAAIDMPIEKNSYRDYMLKEMFNFDESVVLSEDYITTETHSYDDIYEAYTADEISKATASDSSKTEDQMIAQKKGYEAFRGLRKRCKDAMGQKDVFIGTKTTIKANPKYFRVQKNNNA
ncbi:MAG: hypothetical protein V1646_00180 [bacterium]